MGGGTAGRFESIASARTRSEAGAAVHPAPRGEARVRPSKARNSRTHLAEFLPEGEAPRAAWCVGGRCSRGNPSGSGGRGGGGGRSWQQQQQQQHRLGAVAYQRGASTTHQHRPPSPLIQAGIASRAPPLYPKPDCARTRPRRRQLFTTRHITPCHSQPCLYNAMRCGVACVRDGMLGRRWVSPLAGRPSADMTELPMSARPRVTQASADD